MPYSSAMAHKTAIYNILHYGQCTMYLLWFAAENYGAFELPMQSGTFSYQMSPKSQAVHIWLNVANLSCFTTF